MKAIWTRSGWQLATQYPAVDVTDDVAIDALPGGVDQLLLPAPIDLHVHGGGGADCMQGSEAIRRMLATHGQHGTGSLLATSVTAPTSAIDAFLEAVGLVMQEQRDASSIGSSARLLGAHLEGPFINPDKLGAQPPFAVPVDAALLTGWFETGVVRVITFAPEMDPDDALLALCAQYGVRAQIGHSLCDWAMAAERLARGCGITHLYNAMSGVSHRGGGVALAALAQANYAEIITDGVHVDAAAFRAAQRAIPCLYSVSDATAAAGMPDGQYRLGEYAVEKSGDAVRLADGTLAGSCATTRRRLAVLREWGVDWHAIGWLMAAHPGDWLCHEAGTTGAALPGESDRLAVSVAGDLLGLWREGLWYSLSDRGGRL